MLGSPDSLSIDGKSYPRAAGTGREVCRNGSNGSIVDLDYDAFAAYSSYYAGVCDLRIHDWNGPRDLSQVKIGGYAAQRFRL